jgi:MSHA pilin protein MshA
MIPVNFKNKGFTLIELVVVIVILGILAVTAVPKFIDLASDAKVANLEAVGGAMKSGVQLINYKAIIDRQNSDSGVIQINGIDIPLYNGYPSVRGSDSFVEINAQVKAWLDIDAVDRNTARSNRDAAIFFTDKSSPNNQIYIFFTADYDQKSVNFKCHVLYENPESENPDKPIINTETSDC